MAITRTQYITIAELNEILGVSTYTEDNLVQVYEASELLEYHINDQLNAYDTSSAPTELKLATAYQVKYMEDGNDEFYSGDSGSMTIGKYSISNNKTNAGEYSKISPKSRRYVSGLTRRIV